MADVSLVVGTILEDWSPDIADNITDRNEMLAYYKERDSQNSNGRKGYRVVKGGRQFNETLFTAVNGTFGGYDDRETIRTDVGNPITEAQYAQKIVAGSINLSKLEDAQNMPDYQIHDLAMVKKEEAEYSMNEILGASALSDGTTDTKIPGGLQLIISATNNTVGTIDGSARTFWRPNRDTTGVTAWNTSDEGLIALETLFGQCSRGAEKPDLIVTTVAIRSLINIMQIKNHTININDGTKKASLGYDDVYYRGAKVISDDNVPSSFLYLVNTRHLRFSVLQKGEFKMTKMKEPTDGLYEVGQLYVFCNWTCSARRLQGLMTGIVG